MTRKIIKARLIFINKIIKINKRSDIKIIYYYTTI